MKIYYAVKGVVRQEQYPREKLSSGSRHRNGREYRNRNRLKYKYAQGFKGKYEYEDINGNYIQEPNGTCRSENCNTLT